MKQYYLLTFLLLLSFNCFSQQYVVMKRTGSQKTSLSACTSYIVTDDGNISRNYSNNSNNTQMLIAPEGYRIHLYGQYETEEGNDVISIYNGPIADEASLIISLTGNGYIDTISATDTLTIVFQSNASINSSGFAFSTIATMYDDVTISHLLATPNYNLTTDITWLDTMPNSTWTVRYGTNKNNLNQTQTSNTNGVQLIDLSPSTTYYYSVANNNIDPTGSGTICITPSGSFVTPCPNFIDNVVATTDSHLTATIVWEDHISTGPWTFRYGTNRNNLTESITTDNIGVLLTRLLPSTRYYYSIAIDSIDPTGSGSTCITYSGNFSTLCPNYIYGVHVTTNNDMSADITWGDRLSSGPWTVRYGTNRNSLSDTINTDTISVSISHLSPSTTYYYTIAIDSIDSTGTASSCITYSGNFRSACPNYIYNVTTTPNNDLSASITWSDRISSGPWTVRYGTNRNNLTEAINTDTIGVVLPGLQPSTTYYYSIAIDSIDSIGNGSSCFTYSGNFRSACPKYITNIHATPYNNMTATIEWTDIVSNGPWTLRYGTSSNNYTSEVHIYSETATIEFLAPSTTYYFSIAIDSLDSTGKGSTCITGKSSVKTKCPNIIRNARMSEPTETSVTLLWDDTVTSGPWTVRYGLTAASKDRLIVVDTLKAVIEGLNIGTLYYYSIASNSVDTSGDGSTCVTFSGTFETSCNNEGTCIDFTDLTGCRTKCYYGEFNNPQQSRGVVNYGSTDFRSRHTVNYTRTYDTRATRRGDTLWTIPDGEIASVRLGNWQTGAQAECISYQYTVDTNVADLLILKYAAVLENPNHNESNQPLFMFDFTDLDGNEINPACYSATFVPGYTQSDWHGTSSLKWKDWTTVGVDLTPLHGMTFNINLTTKDCLQRGHYGYAYFTLGCDRKAFYTTTCGYSVDNDITAPDGFLYRWYKEAEPTVTLSTERTLHISEYGTFACDLSFAGGASGNAQCGFTMKMTAGPRFAQALFTPVTIDTVNCRSRVTFHNASVVTEDPEHSLLTLDQCNAYLWIIDDSITFTDAEPTYDFGGGHHQVTLIAYIGNGDCGDTLRHTYEFDYLPGATVGYDSDTVVENDLPNYTYLDKHFTTDVDDTIFMLTNSIGCDSTHHFRLHVCRNVDTTVYGAVCENTFPISWNGGDFTGPGSKQLFLTNRCGADSNVTLVLGTVPTYSFHYTDTICDNQLYSRSGQTFGDAGDHDIALYSMHGCDSVEHITLHVMPTYIDTDHLSICRFDSVMWHDGLWHRDIATPLPQAMLHSRYGCDSLMRLDLEVREVTYATDRDTVTENNLPAYRYNGAAFISDVNDTMFRLTNSVRCDSLLTFSLYVCRNQDTVLERIECDNTFPYQWYDGTFDGPDTQQFTYPNRCGADSNVTLRFAAYPTYSTYFIDTICDNQRFSQSGQTFNDAGDHDIQLYSIFGCDSIEHVTLHVMPTYIDTDHLSICRFDSVMWHDSLWHYDIATPLPQAMLHSVYGCDSLMHLDLEVREVTYATDRDTVTVNNLPAYRYNGAAFVTDVSDTLFVLTNSVMCDSMLTFSLYVCRNEDTVLSRVECANTFPYQWYDGTFNGPDTLQFTYPNWCGADSNVTLRFAAYPTYLKGYTGTICDNQSFIQSGQTFSTEGEHEIMLRTMHDCDSVENLLLHVLPTYDIAERNVICRGDVLRWLDGNDYSMPPLRPARHMLRTHDGCDSLITLVLIINEHSYTTIRDTVTENNLPAYTFNGIHFATDVRDTVFRFSNAVQCDSLLTFSLYVCRNQEVTLQRAECDNKFPIQWYDGHFSGAGTQNFRYATFCGADSNVTLTVKAMPTYFTQFVDTICASKVFWRSGEHYMASGTYDKMHTTRDGCDSLEREVLTVMPTYNDTDHVVLCWQDTFVWVNGLTYVAEPMRMPSTMLFSSFGCDSMLTLDLTVNPPVGAALKAMPERATIDDPYITLTDGSLNSVRRHWYALGALIDSISPVTFRFPVEEREVPILMIAYDKDGCSDTATTTVTIERSDIIVPNIFTPTKIDNNVVKISGIDIDQFEARIYDRRGQLVFTFHSLDDVWDGTYNGKLCQQESYVYKIRYTTIHHPKSWLHKVGTITLVR